MMSRYGQSALKASLLHFFLGKALNAVVGAASLVLLARWMVPDEYGSYVALIALQAALLAVSTLGVESSAERFLPEFRTQYPDEHLLGFVLSVLVARAFTLGVVVAIAVLAAEPLSRLIGLAALAKVLQWWALAIASFGALSFTSILLEAMLQQKHAQTCMSLYLTTKFVAICVLHQLGALDLPALIRVEIGAGGLAALVALLLLTRQFHRGGLAKGWLLVLENRARLGRFAAFNFLAQLVFQCFSAEVMKLLVTRLLGAAAAASYGFAASLAEMVQRYLPATLLQRLIKPVFVSRYLRSGDFGELNQMGRLILKLNLLLLVPAIALSVAYGADLLGLLTQGKYADGHGLLVGALCLLVPASHQAVLSMLAGTLERNAMQFYAGLVSALGFPLALALIPRWGSLGAIAAAAASSLVYNILASWYLRRGGYAYGPDWRALAVFLGLGLALTLALAAAKAWGPLGLAQAAMAGGMLMLYLALIRLFGAFKAHERATLNALLPKPVFIF